jgi:catechol 2,3-dioxygenase-like lactoylglutathione lyase family enzyme
MDSFIQGLDHLQLAMPTGEEARARAFYGKLLGLAELAKPAELAARGGCWFALGNQALHLGVETPFAPARKAHPAFLVSDLEGLQVRLEGAGVSTLPDTTLPSVRRFYAADPFGNRLEFLQDEDTLT